MGMRRQGANNRKSYGAFKGRSGKTYRQNLQGGTRRGGTRL